MQNGVVQLFFGEGNASMFKALAGSPLSRNPSLLRDPAEAWQQDVDLWSLLPDGCPHTRVIQAAIVPLDIHTQK